MTINGDESHLPYVAMLAHNSKRSVTSGTLGPMLLTVRGTTWHAKDKPGKLVTSFTTSGNQVSQTKSGLLQSLCRELYALWSQNLDNGETTLRLLWWYIHQAYHEGAEHLMVWAQDQRTDLRRHSSYLRYNCSLHSMLCWPLFMLNTRSYGMLYVGHFCALIEEKDYSTKSTFLVETHSMKFRIYHI